MLSDSSTHLWPWVPDLTNSYFVVYFFLPTFVLIQLTGQVQNFAQTCEKRNLVSAQARWSLAFTDIFFFQILSSV